MRLTERTVLYGGSFNPPHVGHQMACLYLLEAIGAAEVWLLPAARHPFGKELAPFAHRRAMCELLARPFSGRVVVNPVEAETGQSGRTFDTLLALEERHRDRAFALAVGSDIMQETEQWYHWHDIVARFPVVVIGRTGYPYEAAPIALPAVASGTIRRLLKEGRSIAGMVPLSVADYIDQHRLFRP
jgi:nicotinate-nucleotide adenylyltransferase